MKTTEIHVGLGRLLHPDGADLAPVRYEYQIDRHNRVWHGTAVRTDDGGALTPPGGPALLETEGQVQSPVNYYQRTTPDGIVIVFTGRGAPPGE